MTNLAKPFVLSIDRIVRLIKRHCELDYVCGGAERLPLLAMRALYMCLLDETARYSGMSLGPTEGSTFSVVTPTGEVYETVDVSKIEGGVYTTLKYYLRLLDNTADFIDNYVELLKADENVKYPHQAAWNELVSNADY